MNINKVTKKITFEALKELCDPSMLIWLQDENEICLEHNECGCLSSLHDHLIVKEIYYQRIPALYNHTALVVVLVREEEE